MKTEQDRLPVILLAQRYRMRRLLGHGGMGAVYEALDENLNAPVAVKVLLRKRTSDKELADRAARLRDEARAVAKVASPHLIKIIDAGEEPDIGPYIVYELLTRGSLRDCLTQKTPFTEKDVLERIARPLLMGLTDLHQNNIIHRDIKPDNIFQSSDDTFLVGDLGLAVFEGREAQTETGMIVGTPGYLAPEIFMANKVGPLADNYSGAVVITEALAGKLPYRASSPAELVKEQLAVDLSPKELTALGISTPVAAVLSKALARQPERRHKDAAQFLTALESAFQEPVIEKTKERSVQTKKQPMWFGIMFLLIFCLLVFLTVSSHSPKKKAAVLTKSNPLFTKLFATAHKIRLAKPFPSALQLHDFITKVKKSHHQLKKKNRWKNLLSTFPAKAPVRYLLQSVDAQLGNKDEILAAVHARNAALEMRSVLKRKTGLDPSAVSLETFYLNHRFFCLKKVGIKGRTKILDASSFFMAKLRNKIGENKYFEAHRLFIFLSWALAYADGRADGCLTDMKPSLSVLCYRPRYDDYLDEIISSHCAYLQENMQNRSGTEFQALAALLSRRQKDKTLAKVCHETSDMGAQYVLAGEASINFFPNTARKFERFLNTAQNRSELSKVNQSISLLRRAAWAFCAANIPEKATPEARERYVDLLLDIAETQADHDLFYVHNEDWGIGFSVEQTIRRALLHVDVLLSQWLDVEGTSRYASYGNYLLKTSEEWLEEVTDINNKLAQEIAPLFGRLATKKEMVPLLLRSWYEYRVDDDKARALELSSQAFFLALHELKQNTAPSQKTVDSEFARTFAEVCQFRWRMLHELGKTKSRIEETKWVADYFAPIQRERDSSTGIYRLIWAQAIIHHTSATKQSGQATYLDIYNEELKAIAVSKHYGKQSAMARDLLNGKRAGIPSP